ncbi:uncharacterized protein C8Q71DRAFT_392900 [Rhodofomes roseus]|uniref:Transmembrane protein n=1 Tax=Rhodofomes roseus TaxID=34475 RepID=A0ABQ8JZT5_9APHY|nr:uncharacterized protein C8Q71DRAFT_392900 [Rhodofomes roseus]KAH9829886.1 hypothetical protein C8Q71DRAFT_392900 [Rhodofomes roseus]
MNFLAMSNWMIAVFSFLLYSPQHRSSLIVADVLVLLVTWWQLCGTVRSSGQGRNRSALVALLLRDSTSYFILLLLLNISQVMAQLMLADFNPIPNLMLPIINIVISRLILSLRRLSFTMRLPLYNGSATNVLTVDMQESVRQSFLSTVFFRIGSNGRGSNASSGRPVPQELSLLRLEGSLEAIHVPWHVKPVDACEIEDEKEHGY